MIENVKKHRREKIVKEGFEALLEKLGPAGTLEFIECDYPGKGDYTAEKQANPDTRTVDEILKEIETMREKNSSGALD